MIYEEYKDKVLRRVSIGRGSVNLVDYAKGESVVLSFHNGTE